MRPRSPMAAGVSPPLRGALALAAFGLAGAASPCLAQATAKTTATVVIQEPTATRIAADFVGQNGIALSVVTPAAGTSSLAVTVGAVPPPSVPVAQDRLLSVSANAFRSLIPVGSIVSIIDTRLIFDSAQIDGNDSLLLVLLQYN